MADHEKLLSALRNAAKEVERLRSEKQSLVDSLAEAIAIVGMGCRFPGGVTDLDAFWRLLDDGIDAISEVPRERWDIDALYDPDPDVAGKMITRWGGFLSDIDQFDPSFFGISPREAAKIDPQQRLVLETSWEAVERAGLVPERLMGSDTGVFLGLMYQEYAMLGGGLEALDGHVLTGSAGSIASGRISYLLGLKGPSLTVDTACSSSLVTVHLACQALRQRECSMALAGGVTLMLTPATFVEFSRLRGLAADGRCKSFSAAADGTVWSEGCGMLVLKRLSDAQRDGDPILAVIRGSAVNQDGRSNGLTAPNGPSQQTLIRRALQQAGVTAAEIGYVECHGTGTSLGDPIEVQALGAALGEGRDRDRPVVIGSVKSNIGHTQAAAGAAGIIKVALAFEHGRIPKSLHFETPSPHIPWDELPVQVAAEAVDWPRSGVPRLAGVSSFGISGTNAHVILREPPLPTCDADAAPGATSYLVPLSAKSPEALRALARSYAGALAAEPGVRLHDFAYTASVRRAHHDSRLAIVGQTRAEISKSLAAFGHGDTAGKNTASSGRPKVVFVFPGQGSQWLGMGRQLLTDERVFREAMQVCDEAIRRLGGFSVLDELAADDARSRLGEIDVVQPALFAVEVALAELWRSWGVEPDAVMGHSMGEIAAARVAGILSLDDAAQVICRRSRLLRRFSGRGAMALVELGLTRAQHALTGYGDRLSVAVSNGPQSTVLSGDPEALDEVLSALEKSGVFCRRVKVDVASHSPQMDPLRDELLAAVREVRPRPAQLAMRSTVTGDGVRGPELDAAYWVNNLREPVLFAAATQGLIDDGHAVFVEISPHPILLPSIEENLQEKQQDGVAVASLRRNSDERRTMLEALGVLYEHGYPVDWERLYPSGGRCVPLPNYPWQRRRYWIEETERPAARWAPTRRAGSTATAAGGERENWLWEVQWRRKDRSPAPGAPAPGPWLVLDDRGGTGSALVAWLRTRGATCVRAVAGQALRQLEPGLWEIDPGDGDAYRALLHEAFIGTAPCRGVVSLFGLDAPSADDIAEEMPADHQRLASESALLLSQAVLQADSPRAPRLWLVTRGAVAASGEASIAMAQAPLWGFGRTLQMEHPELACTLVDLAPGGSEVDALGAELVEGDDEDQIALRSGGRLVARLAPRALSRGAMEATRFSMEASYLITGGLGGLGLTVAGWMVEHGARHIVLVGRSAASAAAREVIARMEELRAKIIIAAADVSQKADVDALIARIRAEFPPLRGVVHAAGVLQDRTVLQLSVDAMRDVAAPKMLGAWNLHAATRDHELEFFVLYASSASLLGAPGQGNYAAANAFLDALAHDRRARGLTALAIDWGPFSRVGLAAAQANRGERLAAMGFRNISPDEGTEVLGTLLAGAVTQVGVIPMAAERAIASPPRLLRAPYFSEVLRGTEQRSGKDAATRAWLQAVLAASPAERPAQLERLIHEALAQALRQDPSQIERTKPFNRYGLDSLMALELRNRLQDALGIKLSVIDIVTHARIDALAVVLAERLAGAAAPTDESRTEAVPAPNERPAGSWVVIPRPSPQAQMRLFCFPYGGGGAHMFSSWPAGLPAEIEVCAIQPPGRHERAHEPLVQSVEEMVAALVPALLPYLDRPFAMFGHCLGAIVMFEVLRELAAKHGLRPAHVFASGAPSPRRYLVASLADRSQQEFVELLRLIGFADAGVLQDQEVVRDLIPAVRADFQVAASYEYVPSVPLDAPLSIFAGKDDPFAPPDVVEEWRSQTSSWSSKVVFPGGHYFIVPERTALLQMVGQELLFRLASINQRRRAEGSAELWLAPSMRPTTRRARLFCFPGVGHGADIYESWSTRLGEDVEVCAVHLPGRGHRAHELPLGRVDDIVEHFMTALRAELTPPYAFFGIDIGAIVAFEITRQLRREGSSLPGHIFVAAATAPHLYFAAPWHHLPRERLLRELRILGASLDDGAELALRAECAAMASYTYVAESPLNVPLTAFIGDRDSFVAPAGIRGWRRQTAADFILQVVRGTHDLLIEDQFAVLNAVHQVLDQGLG